MTGTFELFADADMTFRFRLKSPDGTVFAVSKSFPDKQAAVTGISAVREYAGMGLITDLCPNVPLGPAIDPGASRHSPAPDIPARPCEGLQRTPGPVPAVHRRHVSALKAAMAPAPSMVT